MAHTERVTALVLDRTPYGDYDRIYTLLTLERGMLRARARGAAKPKAKVRPHIEGFGAVDVMLVRGRGGWLLASAEMLEPIRMPSAEAQLLAGTARRILARVLREHDPDLELFEMLLALYRDLAYATTMRGSRELLLRETHFFWSLLGALGYNGSIDQCNLCGKKLNGTSKFVPLAGAFFCAACAKAAGVLVSELTRDYLRQAYSATRAALVDPQEFFGALAEHFTHRLDLAYPEILR